LKQKAKKAFYDAMEMEDDGRERLIKAVMLGLLKMPFSGDIF
jgi:hypothetical protein